VLVWGISGICLCFPGALDSFADGQFRFWITRLHFGRFDSFTEALWTIGFLDDRVGEARVAQQMVQFPLAEPATREFGFLQLSGVLSPYVFPDDPAKERKLTDLEDWIRCAQEAESANVRTPSMPQEAESVMNRTTGFVALMRQRYDIAGSKLQIAISLNTQDALANLWPGWANGR
jgi:hypothetical protein